MKGRERKYIGDKGEKKIPIPDAFYKIVIKQNGGTLDVLALVYPHKEIKKLNKKYNHNDFLTTVDTVERLTGIDFLTDLDDDKEDAVESKKADRIWKF